MSALASGGTAPEKEGAWAREYRQGRAAQVAQQRIANLIAISDSQCLTSEDRRWAAREALAALKRGAE